MKSLTISMAALACWLSLAPPASAQKAALGVTMSDNTRGGVLIMNVIPGSPAAAIGLQSGDRIMAIGGKPVATYQDVGRLIASYKPNARVELKIDRGGWTKTTFAVLGDVRRVMTTSAAPTLVAPMPAVRPGSLYVPRYIQDLQNESPADIDDQHGFGG
jgi:predicted metalloprotease with PDZ domain